MRRNLSFSCHPIFIIRSVSFFTFRLVFLRNFRGGVERVVFIVRDIEIELISLKFFFVGLAVLISFGTALFMKIVGLFWMMSLFIIAITLFLFSIIVSVCMVSLFFWFFLTHFYDIEFQLINLLIFTFKGILQLN